MRIIAAASLVFIAPKILGLWFAADFFAFTALKLLFGTYRWFKPAPIMLTHVFNIVSFVFVNFLPGLTFRNMYGTLCGLHYTITFIYGYVASISMMYVGIHLSSEAREKEVLEARLREVAALAIASATLILFISTVILKRKYARLWVSTINPAQHFSAYVWNTFMYGEWGSNLDDHKALAVSMTFCHSYYEQDKRVEKWIRENWEAWEEYPPFWFDANFRHSLPLSMLPEHVREHKRNVPGPRRWSHRSQKTTPILNTRRKIVPVDSP